MSTITKEFTKEQLIASAHARIEFAEMMLAVSIEPLKERTWLIELELARIALASLEAEACTADVSDAELNSALLLHRLKVDGHSQLSDAFRAGFKYARRTAPPAPVSVPEPIKRNDADGWWMYKGRRVGGGCAEWYNRALDDCRAAFLRGLELSVPDYDQVLESLDSDVRSNILENEHVSQASRATYDGMRAAMLQGGKP